MNSLLGVVVALLISLAIVDGDAQAKTTRNVAELRAFQRAMPCPSTGLHRGPCPGWQIDHVEPICAGGADRRDNMQWMTLQEHKWKTRTDVRVCRGLRKPQIDRTLNPT